MTIKKDRISWNKGKKSPWTTERNLRDNPAKRLEVQEKMKEIEKIRTISIKKQFTIVPLVMSGIIAIIVAGVMIYAVFFPVATQVNQTSSGSLVNIAT
jgi:hypothetical protein